ncbi:MAG: TAXI family TRAP transporter solute-binding subunit [Burkholderiales bacterium]
MFQRFFITLMMGLLVLPAWAQRNLQYNIVTASENGTYIQIGRDLANFVAPAAGIDLKALPSKGSVENMRRLRDEPGTKLALVQSDVYQAFKDLAARGNVEAERIVRPLRVVLPLYNEEIYVVTRSDSPLKYLSEIRNQRINIGPIGSGSAITASTLYQSMFGLPISESQVSSFSNEEALIRLVRDRSIDVVILVAGQPSPIFLGMEPGVEKYFKLLSRDDSAAVSQALITYSKSEIRSQSYPQWLAKDVPALAVKTMIVTYDYSLPQTRDALARLAKSLCDNFPLLQAKGHPKWSDVSLKLPPLSPDWSYYPSTEAQINNCSSTAAIRRPSSSPNCPFHDRVLGLCS